MVSLQNIKLTIQNINAVEGSVSVEGIDTAIQALEGIAEDLEKVAVRGKDDCNKILGVMLVIDGMLGKEEKG